MLSLGVDGWMIFEIYTRSLIGTPSLRKFDCRPCVGKKEKEEYSSISPHTLGGCKEIRQVVDIVKAAKGTRSVLFHSVKRENELIDFIYQDKNGAFHASQATVGKKHKAYPQKIQTLVYLIQDGDKSIGLSLYYLVPGDQFAEFVTSPVKPGTQLANVTSCKIWHALVPDPNGSQDTGSSKKGSLKTGPSKPSPSKPRKSKS